MPRITAFMTPAAVTVGENVSCHEAHALMRRLHVRHLPVVRAGRPVGILSLHGLTFSAATHCDQLRTPVSDVMEPAVIVAGATPVPVVARRMIEEKLNAVLVTDGEQLGIFTTVDALYVIVRLTQSDTQPPPPYTTSDRRPL